MREKQTLMGVAASVHDVDKRCQHSARRQQDRRKINRFVHDSSRSRDTNKAVNDRERDLPLC